MHRQNKKESPEVMALIPRQRLNQAPGLMVCLLVTVVVARIGIVFVVDSPLITAVGWASLLGALGLAAWWGKAAASRALAYLCILLGADTLLQLLNADVPRVHLVAALLWASLVIGVGVYLLVSPEVKRFHARQAEA